MLLQFGLLVATAPEEFDEDQVTPGIVGFIATFLIMVVVVLLVLDMVRRIRRVNYRAEAQAKLDAEEAEAAEMAELATEVDGESVDGGWDDTDGANGAGGGPSAR